MRRVKGYKQRQMRRREAKEDRVDELKNRIKDLAVFRTPKTPGAARDLEALQERANTKYPHDYDYDIVSSENEMQDISDRLIELAREQCTKKQKRSKRQ